MPLILIHSPKGGVGCSTLAANLSAWLARGGRRVMAVDFASHENLSLHLARDLPDSGADDTRHGLRLAARSAGASADQLIAEIERSAAADDMLIVADVPASERAVVDRLAPRALIRLCVLAADAGSAAMLPVIQREATQPGAPRRHFVLNALDDRRSVAREFHHLLRSVVGEDLVAVIRSDEAVNEALASMVSVFDHAPASAAASDIATLADRIAASIDALRHPPQDVAA